MRYLNTAVLLLLLPFSSHALFGQAHDVEELIWKKDALFWQDYNSCNTSRLDQFFTDDVEFYHDKNGATSGFHSFVEGIKSGLCQSGSNWLRREAVAASVKVFLLKKDGQPYGAILSSDHVFYVKQEGKGERLDGRAKFTHLWLLNNGNWRMARVLSYDHGPAIKPSNP